MSGKPIDAEDIAVLLRLQAALPDVGLNGWFEGVRVLARVIEHLTAAQQQGQAPPPSAPVGVEGFDEWYDSVDARFWDNWDACNAAFHAGKRAALAPLQAEIEALRAEVEFLRRGIVPRDDDMIVPVNLLDEINASGAEWKARAERLAEAIRAYKSECDNPAKDYVMRAKRRDEMFAALNHTAAQENDDA